MGTLSRLCALPVKEVIEKQHNQLRLVSVFCLREMALAIV